MPAVGIGPRDRTGQKCLSILPQNILYDNVDTDSTVEQEIPLDVEVSPIELQSSQVDYNTVAGVSAELPQEPLPDSVPLASFQSWPQTPGIGAAYERPVDPRVSGTNRGHLGLWEEVAKRVVNQNATVSTRRTSRSYWLPSDPLQFVSIQVTDSMPGTVMRDEEMVGLPAGEWMTWRRASWQRTQEVPRELNRRRGKALTTPVTTSVPTQTTTSVLFSSSTPPVTLDAGVMVGIYTHAGMSWSTATTTSVLGPFHCKPITGGSRRNTEEPSPSSQTRSEQMYTRAAADSYDSYAVRGYWT